MSTLLKPIAIRNIEDDFIEVMTTAADKAAKSRPDSGGYYTLAEPLAFNTIDGHLWFLRKLKPSEGYTDSGFVTIHGAGTSDLSSVVNDPATLEIRLKRHAGIINFTS